jgi:hypothetical protein
MNKLLNNRAIEAVPLLHIREIFVQVSLMRLTVLTSDLHVLGTNSELYLQFGQDRFLPQHLYHTSFTKQSVNRLHMIRAFEKRQSLLVLLSIASPLSICPQRAFCLFHNTMQFLVFVGQAHAGLAAPLTLTIPSLLYSNRFPFMYT